MPTTESKADITRERLLDEASQLFAERGFYGVSLADVSGALGLTKQGLLHHFGNKKRLYAEVLERIADAYDARRSETDSISDPKEALKCFLLGLDDGSAVEQNRVRLLVRELLDNLQRMDTAKTWYLKPFLDNLIAMLRRCPGWGDVPSSVCLAALAQIIGAISYNVAAAPTFAKIYNDEGEGALEAAFKDSLAVLVEATLSAPPPRC
ncbi:MAG: TetR/AcrR family transcriptional regulator [Pseudomonadota bacterium]